MRLFSRLSMMLAVCTLALPSAARAGDPPVGLHPFAAVDIDSFTAASTFRAIFGSAQLPAYGGGVDITSLWGHLFARVAVTHLTKTGTRVFVDNGQVFKLNIPAKLTLTPVEIGGGWRFDSRRSRVTPYVGGAAVVAAYRVTYASADSSDNESQSFKGGTVFGGAEVAIYKMVTIGGEAQYRFLPNALQSNLASSAANAYGEKDLGGLVGRLTIGVKLGK